MKKILPIGIENFPDMIRNHCYYVDKTAFIKTVMTSGSKVQLITRPRRFGKTLFMGTMKSFLQLDFKNPKSVEGHAALFSDLEILKDQAFCRAYMGQFPVISISLKDVEGGDFSKAYDIFAGSLEALVAQYDFLLTSPKLNPWDKETLRNYLTKGFLKDQTHLDDCKSFLKNMTIWLSKHFDSQVVLLIDEYDVPLAKAAQFGYYDDMLELIRSFLGQILKEAPRTEFDASAYVRKAVLTGCLRVSKESIFTGINNPAINTVCSEDTSLSEVIGFSPSEVETLLSYYGLSSRMDDVKQWYDGYRFAGSEIYCPWDVVTFADLALRSADLQTFRPGNYWEGTGGYSAVSEFLGFLTADDADKMQALVDGETIDLTINEKLTYSDFAQHKSKDFWTLLLFSGYLTVTERLPPLNTYRVRIPNEEIRDTFINNVKERYSRANPEFVTYGQDFAKAALSGDVDGMSDILVPLLENYISVRDTATKAPAENYYHGFLTALLLPAGSYAKDLRSNVEAGDGYADLVFTSGTGSRRIGVIIEVKRSAKPEDMYDAADQAVAQIKAKRYTAFLDRLRCGKQYIYGIAFCRKDCAVSGGSVDAVK